MARIDIELDDRGLRLVRRGWLGRRPLAALAWADVERVEARDGAAGPELAFQRADGSSLAVGADRRGFERLRLALPAALPRADEAWWTALGAGQPYGRRYLVWERA